MSGVWGLERCGVSGDMTLFGVRATRGTIQAVVPRIEAILPSAPRLGLDTSVGDSQAPLGRDDEQNADWSVLPPWVIHQSTPARWRERRINSSVGTKSSAA
jgi:hypothetical protein